MCRSQTPALAEAPSVHHEGAQPLFDPREALGHQRLKSELGYLRLGFRGWAQDRRAWGVRKTPPPLNCLMDPVWVGTPAIVPDTADARRRRRPASMCWGLELSRVRSTPARAQASQLQNLYRCAQVHQSHVACCGSRQRPSSCYSCFARSESLKA